MSGLDRISPLPRRWIAAWVCLGALLTAGCAPSTTNPATDATLDRAATKPRPSVIVVNYPLQYFARRIGGDLIQVVFPVPENQDPAYWEPTGDEIAEIQSADLVLLNGADYAKWTLRATLPWSRTVVTTEGMEESLIEIPDAVVHSHGPEGEHSHAGLVSETWLDPALAIRQSRSVCDALCGLAPEHKTELESRFTDLQRDLQTLADELDDTLGQTSVRWLSAKPLFHYLFARYDAAPEVLHWEAAETIDTSQWESLTSRLDGDPAVLLWNEVPLEATRGRLAAEGVQSLVISTAANTPQQGDFLTVMRETIDAIKSAITNQTKSVERDN